MSGKWFALVLSLAVIGCVEAESPTRLTPGKPYRLSPDELALVQRYAAAETLIPQRARVSAVAAAKDEKGVVVACGYVSGIEFSGLYGPYRAFNGVLAETLAGTVTFVVVGGIAESDSHQIAIEKVCAASGVRIGLGDSTPQSDAEVKALIAQVRGLQKRCSGDEGANPASDVCEQRDETVAQLNQRGWCYGRDGEYGYQAEWHVCQADSIRLPY